MEVAPSLRGGQEAWCRGLKDPEVAAAGALFGLRLINGVDGVRNVEVVVSVIFGQICAWFHPIFMVHDLRGGGEGGLEGPAVWVARVYKGVVWEQKCRECLWGRVGRTRVSSKVMGVMTCGHVMSTFGRELTLSAASQLTATTAEMRMVERSISGTCELWPGRSALWGR